MNEIRDQIAEIIFSPKESDDDPLFAIQLYFEQLLKLPDTYGIDDIMKALANLEALSLIPPERETPLEVQMRQMVEAHERGKMAGMAGEVVEYPEPPLNKTFELISDAARTLDNMIYFANGHGACGPYAIEEGNAVLNRLRAFIREADSDMHLVPCPYCGPDGLVRSGGGDGHDCPECDGTHEMRMAEPTPSSEKAPRVVPMRLFADVLAAPAVIRQVLAKVGMELEPNALDVLQDELSAPAPSEASHE